MTSSAVVAFQVGPDEFDIHRSDNGAQNTQLEPILKESVNNSIGTKNKGLGEITQNQQIKKYKSFKKANKSSDVELNSSSEAINRTPIAERVSLRVFGRIINFADLEAVYVVRDGQVETYYPVWLHPDVVTPWRDHLRVEVYKSGLLFDSPWDMYDKVEEEDPIRVIDGDTLTENFLEDTITERVVREQHANIYALCEKAENMASEYPEKEVGQNLILKNESYIFSIEVTSSRDQLPTGIGQGIFVEIDGRTQRQLELAGANIRFESGGRLNTISDISVDDISEAAAETMIQSYLEFGDNIAAFSPSPYGDIYEALNKTGNVSIGIKPKLSKYL